MLELHDISVRFGGLQADAVGVGIIGVTVQRERHAELLERHGGAGGFRHAVAVRFGISLSTISGIRRACMV